jgi:hypothetical protein
VSVPDNIRNELIRLCSSQRTRDATWTKEAPTKWNPSEAYDPESDEPYTPAGAWQRIVEELTAGCTLAELIMDKPPGKKGYVFHFQDARGERIYVKLQLVSGGVRGRSFHIG